MSLSHSCPTCDGTGRVLVHMRDSDTGTARNEAPCPDCIDGYPKAAVERAAHSVMVYSWSTDAMQDMVSPLEGMDLALAAIRGFHDEGSEG